MPGPPDPWPQGIPEAEVYSDLGKSQREINPNSVAHAVDHVLATFGSFLSA